MVLLWLYRVIANLICEQDCSEKKIGSHQDGRILCGVIQKTLKGLRSNLLNTFLKWLLLPVFGSPKDIEQNPLFDSIVLFHLLER